LRDQSVVHDDQSAAMMCTVILAQLVTPVGDSSIRSRKK
jgi:hypothetical protein